MGKSKKEDGGGGGGAEANPKRDAELLAAVAHSELLQAKLEVTEKSRNDFRDSCKKISFENDKLHDTLYQAERDTIEVITYLKKEDMLKDEQLAQMTQKLRDVKQETKREKQQMAEDFNEQIVELQKGLDARTKEVKLMQGELTQVKEFRRKRQQMQAELESIKQSLFETNREHKNSMQKMEQRFFDEKVRLEQEANQKIAQLAERAHAEAITQLDETTRDVYKENVRLSDALNTQVKATQELQKRFDQLKSEADELKGEKELNDATVRMKITESKKLTKETKALREKVTQLETAISNMIHDFSDERKQMDEKLAMDIWSSHDEINRLNKMLSAKQVETNRVKILAKNIIDERSDLEIFFHEALQQVRNEINQNRQQYITAAREAYQRKMIAAQSGKGDFPKVRTFNRNDQSTNSVMDDLKAAENTSNLEGRKDIRDLTWEQKEKVLRLLFARMNRINKKQQLQRKNKPHKYHITDTSGKIATKIMNVLEDTPSVASTTFLTQQQGDETVNSSNESGGSNIILPAIGLNS